MKAKWAALLTLGAISTILSGCGSQGNSSSSSTGNAAANVTTTTAGNTSDNQAQNTTSDSSSNPVTLTLWHNYGTEDNATATNDLVKAFEQLHPNIKINVVSQPANNYFSLLQASAISHTGPDLTVMWTGLFTLKYKNILTDLNSYIPLSSLQTMNGIKWMSEGFDPSKGVYVVPLENQFYIGFYNKSMFKKAGITSPPQTWSQLIADDKLLKKAGFVPMLYGSGSQNLGSEFYPYYDFSYLMMGAYPLSQWKGFYSGQIPWTDPKVKDQLQKWVSLKQDGYTNPKPLTNINSLGEFENGQAAMIIKGNWDTKILEDKMGSNLGVFVPPFSDSPMKGVVEYPGDGFAVTKFSQHKAEAAQFLKFLLTPQAQQIEAQDGLIPDLKGATTNDPVSNEMLAFADKQGYTPYPMIDNVMQPTVVDTGSKVLDATFAGNMSVDQALQQMKSTWSQLPSGQRGSQYN